MTVIACGWIAAAPAEERRGPDLQDCVTIDDDMLRLACYDAVSGRTADVAANAAAALPAERESAAGNVVPLTEDVGAGQLPSDKRKSDDTIIRGRVTSCRREADRKYYFYFDNGQVWKQKDNDRLKLDDCDFDVTIEKDFFGYKMQIEGKRNRIRIGRIK